MKTMICKQLGGPCDREFHGDTANDVIKDQDQHLRQAVKDGDDTHAPAPREMKGRWKHPKQSMGWYNATQKAFDELPLARTSSTGRRRLHSPSTSGRKPVPRGSSGVSPRSSSTSQSETD